MNRKPGDVEGPGTEVSAESSGNCDKDAIPAMFRRNHKLGGLVNVERIHDIRAMNRNRVGAQVERGSDFFVRFAIDDHLQNFKLARSKPTTLLAFERRGLLNLGIENLFPSSHSPYCWPEFKI